MSNPSILVVDDSNVSRLVLGKILRSKGYRVTDAADGKEAVDTYMSNPFDVVITDMHLPDLSGIDVFKKVRQAGCEKNPGGGDCAPFILCTASPEREMVKEALRTGFRDVMSKPVDASSLLNSVEYCLSL